MTLFFQTARPHNMGLYTFSNTLSMAYGPKGKAIRFEKGYNSFR